MNKSTVIGIAVGAAAVVAIGAVATTRGGLNPLQQYATVISTEQAFEENRIPRTVCFDDEVTRQKPVKDEKRIAGTALGAVVGGVLGSQVGSGSGRDAATVAGAVAGGYAGSKTQKELQERNTETVTVQRCETVYDTEKVPAGFEVTYELEGQRGVIRMDRDPGKRIPVRDGELVLGSS
jgi:uncharacterized protein YcfJ